MCTIKVKFRPSATEGREGVIFYQVIHGGRVRRLGSGYRVLPDEWDDGSSMVRAKLSGERMGLVGSICEGIRRDVERLTRIYRGLDLGGLAYTVDDVVEAFRRYRSEYSLFGFMEGLIVKFKLNGHIRTAETYAAALNSFKRYRSGEDIMLDSLTSDVMEGFEAWHRMRGNTANTVSFYNRILRAVYRRAVECGGVDDRNPFRRVYTGVDRTVKRAISLSYIRVLRGLDLSQWPQLDFARDMFMMSFYLRGMSFVDMTFLRKIDLRHGYVVYRRRKTGQQLTIAWTAEMQAIVDKYPANPTQYLLPIIKRVGINERCAYRNVGYNINHNLKRVSQMLGLDVPLTMYVARHSWASAAKAKGIPVSVISEGMGHDSEATTQIYLASLDTSVVDEANSLILSSL